jgi:hypothetical protein
MVSCPQCGSEEIHLSKRNGIIDICILTVLFVRPFRCDECDFRFYRWSFSPRPNATGPATTY